MLFCVTRAGLNARLSSERLEAGQNRLDKICEIIANSRYSVHDLSRATSEEADEDFRMNMPFELGLDMGRRWAPDEETNDKRFLIFEKIPYELKRCLSDLNGMDVEFHRNEFGQVLKKLRDFLVVEAKRQLPGESALEGDYYTFLGWMTEKKIFEGHTEREAKNLPTRERLDEMHNWMAFNRPDDFDPAIHG